MTKQELTRDIKNEVGNFMNQSQTAKYFGLSRDTVIKMLDGCDYTPVGKKKMYFAGDVADRWLSWRG